MVKRLYLFLAALSVGIAGGRGEFCGKPFPPQPAATLTHGPIVGAVTSTSATVWVRTSGAVSIVVRYSLDPTLATFVESTAITTLQSADFTAHVPITSLLTNTVYYLDVLVGGVASLTFPYPHFQTFPDTPTPFRFVVLTDFKKPPATPFSTFASAAQDAPDFVYLGGDFDHSDPTSLDEKRAMFKALYTPAAGYEDFVPLILRQFAVVHHWDDHDYGKNNSDKTYPYKARSLRVFDEFFPAYAHPSIGIWQSFSYGGLADFFLLDSRSQRDPYTDLDDANKSMLDGDNLGAAGQLEWLKSGLLASAAQWKFILGPVTFNPTNFYPDAWAGYLTERTALVNFIQSNGITGVILLSGDRHVGAIDDGTNTTFPEMLVPNANMNAGACQVGLGTWSEGLYLGPPCRGYGVVTVTAESVLLEVKDQFGVVQLSYIVGSP